MWILPHYVRSLSGFARPLLTTCLSDDHPAVCHGKCRPQTVSGLRMFDQLPQLLPFTNPIEHGEIHGNPHVRLKL